jgi:hypothetical protein
MADTPINILSLVQSKKPEMDKEPTSVDETVVESTINRMTPYEAELFSTFITEMQQGDVQSFLVLPVYKKLADGTPNIGHMFGHVDETVDLFVLHSMLSRGVIDIANQMTMCEHDNQDEED